MSVVLSGIKSLSRAIRISPNTALQKTALLQTTRSPMILTSKMQNMTNRFIHNESYECQAFAIKDILLKNPERADELSPNATGSYPKGMLPLHLNIRSLAKLPGLDKTCDSLKTLLKMGANPNRINAEGNTALFIPKIQSNFIPHRANQIVKILLEHGADPDFTNPARQSAAYGFFESLDYAPFGEDYDIENIIRTLLPRMKYVDRPDINGWTLLHHAVYKQRMEFVFHLLERNANPNSMTNNGITPYDLAVYRRNRNICYELERWGGKEPEKHKLPKDEYGLERYHPVERHTPPFFAEMTTKLIDRNQKYWRNIDHLFRVYKGNQDQQTGLYFATSPSKLAGYDYKPDPVKDSALPRDIKTESLLRELYWPVKDSKSEIYITPMGKAIKDQNLKQVELLIQKGWNTYIEDDFILGTAYFRQVKVEGFSSAIREEKGILFSFAKSVLEQVCKAPNTGVTLASEFRSAFQLDHEIDRNYALFLLNNGLSSKLFYETTGDTLIDFLADQYRWRSDDRPPFTNHVHDEIDFIRDFVVQRDKKGQHVTKHLSWGFDSLKSLGQMFLKSREDEKSLDAPSARKP